MFRHLLQGQTNWKVQGLSDLKFEIKCDHRNLIILALLVATDWDKSMGGRMFHKQGILEKKKFLAELLEEI